MPDGLSDREQRFLEDRNHWRADASFWRAEAERLRDERNEAWDERDKARDLAARMCADYGRQPQPRFMKLEAFGCRIDEGDQ